MVSSFFESNLEESAMSVVNDLLSAAKKPAEAAKALDLTVDQVETGYANIKRKIMATEYLRMEPLMANE